MCEYMCGGTEAEMYFQQSGDQNIYNEEKCISILESMFLFILVLNI